MITDYLDRIFAGQDVDGEVDVDGVLDTLECIMDRATLEDVPELLEAIRSPKNNFWTRELLSAPLCNLDGPSHLGILLDAAQLGIDEGHDNDHFHHNLIEMVEAEPERSNAKLMQLMSTDTFRHREAAKWLLEYCATDKA